LENWGWEGAEDYKSMGYYQLQIKNRPFEAEYGAIDPDNKIARQQYLDAHPEFRDDRNRIKAMDAEFPEPLIEVWVEWYAENRSGYEDDWWLMEHPEFYKAMYDLNIWTKPRDFSKVPTKEVYSLYKIYQGLPTGKPRLNYRAKHPELDDWLVLAFGYKPVGGAGDPGAPPTPWEEMAQVEAFEELF
jgi:hypothetical protein